MDGKISLCYRLMVGHICYRLTVLHIPPLMLFSVHEFGKTHSCSMLV